MSPPAGPARSASKAAWVTSRKPTERSAIVRYAAGENDAELSTWVQTSRPAGTAALPMPLAATATDSHVRSGGEASALRWALRPLSAANGSWGLRQSNSDEHV